MYNQRNESHSVVSDSLQPHGIYSPWNYPGQNTGVGICSLLQGIFPTHGLKPDLLHCIYKCIAKKTGQFWEKNSMHQTSETSKYIVYSETRSMWIQLRQKSLYLVWRKESFGRKRNKTLLIQAFVA